jgi:predicted nucleic acid-binding protein
VSVLVDTSALFALLDRRDAMHLEARDVVESLEREELMTHNYVLLEATALVHRRLGAAAVRALDELLAIIGTTVWIDDIRHSAGVAALLAALPTQISLVDFISFNTMRELGLTHAFAFDADFRRAGFRTLP